jgi:hypothetical protein
VPGGVPQGSPLSPILFLFYNAGLLELCEDLKLRTTGIGFIDDANILAYGPTTASNVSALERIHTKLLEWAKRYGMKFAPKKYELIHFARRKTRFDMTATINLGSGIEKTPTQEVRVLRVQLDTKLKWTAQMKKIREKRHGLEAGLSRIAVSTWGASFKSSRQVYNASVRPSILYGAAS